MEKIQFKDLPDMTTPLSSANLNLMQDNMEDAIVPIKLVSISDTAPASATIGDMYYNTIDNKVYTATSDNVWDSGNIPRYDGFYINEENNAIYYYNGETLSGTNSADTTPIGSVMIYAGTTIPENWMKCDGQALSRTTYIKLFSAIGTSYGNGDGSTTFNVPNIQGRFPIGISSSDTDFNTVGKTGGSKTHVQTINEVAEHHHATDGWLIKWGKGISASYVSADMLGGVTPSNNPYAASNLTNSVGEADPMDIMNPYIVMNYIIKAL